MQRYSSTMSQQSTSPISSSDKAGKSPFSVFVHTLLLGITMMGAKSLLLVFLLTQAPSAHAADTTATEATLDFTLPTLTGNTVQLSAHKGEVVYVDFWATWCPPCRKSFPWMEEMHRKYKDAGLTIIAVSIDGKRESIEAFLKSNPVTFIIAHDKGGKTADSFGLQGMPTSYLIDRSGHLHYTHAGFRESDRDVLESRIKSLLAQ